jgi:hypothetical protein
MSGTRLEAVCPRQKGAASDLAFESRIASEDAVNPTLALRSHTARVGPAL